MRAIGEAGFDLSAMDNALAFRIHGITVEYLQGLLNAGFEDLDADEVLKIKIHGLDELMLKRRRVIRR